MKECRYCKESIKDEKMICPFCGYDFKTDTISQSFKPQEKKKRKDITQHGIDSRVKRFTFIGLGIVAFSLFYKYNFNLNIITQEITQAIKKLKTTKFGIPAFKKKAAQTEGKTEWVDIWSFEGTPNTPRSKRLVVEGICFDPHGRSFVTVSGKVLSEGENFKGVTIKKINADSVELIIEGEIKVLKLNQSIGLPRKK